MEREAENPHHQIVSVRGESLQFFRCQHAMECLEQGRHGHGQCDVVQQPAQVLQRVGHALQKVHLALVESAKTVGPQRLHDADINVSVVVVQERLALNVCEALESVQIMVEQLLSQLRRQVSLRVEQQRGDVILQRALASALIVEKVRLPIPEHDVTRLKIAIKEKVAWSAQQKLGQPAEIIFERLFAEGDARQAKKIIFEVIQIPGDRLPVKACPRIANLVVQIACGFNLKTGQRGNRLAVGVHHRGSNARPCPVLRQKFEKRRVTQILFEVSALIEVLGVDLRDGQPMLAEVAGELEECDVFFPNTIK